MLETNYQITCDQCDDDCRENEPVHSMQEIGLDATIGQFREVLKSLGWRFVKGKDFCPQCAARKKKKDGQMKTKQK